jgi:hypothetical protein
MLLETANAGFVKHTSGQVLRSKELQIILNMFHCTKSKYPEKNICWEAYQTVQPMGISGVSVMYIHFFTQNYIYHLRLTIELQRPHLKCDHILGVDVIVV